MKPTNLEWEDVIQFEEVDGYGKEVWKHNNQYYIVNIEGGMMDNELFMNYRTSYFPCWRVGRKHYEKYLIE